MFKHVKCLFIAFLVLYVNIGAFSQTETLKTERVAFSPVIDGNINDSVWENAEIATNFIQYQPYNGYLATFESEVKFIYDDEAIYISAKLYDSSPDSIYNLLSKRDEFGQSDYFGVYIDPFNEGLISYGFFVTAAGVQVDIKLNSDVEDKNWDAVWKSEVKINADYWTVEMQIPYSAIRFPTDNIQKWSVNYYRNIQRFREISTWKLIDPKISGRSSQAGIISGIENIDAPLRLSFFPYFSYYTQFRDNEISGYQAIGGMDLKLGLNESFTLDMMLIPDFGELQSDDNVLNLSPYETYYDEKRAFFTEGTEMFQKGDIFYSRRIGTKPQDYDNVKDNLRRFETIEDNPTETQIINAVKISGRTNKGLGLGFLNTVTSNTYATLYDTINGTSRKIQTHPYTNYNVLVADKTLKNNSYISLINTNVCIPFNKYYSNVTAFDAKLVEPSNNYAIFVKAGVSQIYNQDDSVNSGHFYLVKIAKISGNFRFSSAHKVLSDNYNPNDLGYLSQNNQIINSFAVNYNIYKPFWKMLNLYNSLSLTYTSLYLPKSYISADLNYTLNTTFTNHFSVMAKINYRPKETYDYFEPRVDNRFFITPPNKNFSLWLSSDYRRKIAFDVNAGYYFANNEDMFLNGGWYSVAPRLRLSDKLLFVYSFTNEFDLNSYGYVNKTENGDSIFFGERDIITYTNLLKATYIFNNKSSIDLKLRHYWTTVNYEEYFTLQQDGSLKELTRSYRFFKNSDINYNTFNIDLVYNLQFAPGSEFSIVWKNYITTSEDEIVTEYKQNLENLFEINHTNSLSMKLIYYLDYQYLKKKTLLRRL